LSAPEVDLDGLVRELEDAAARLRAGQIEPEEAGALIDRCAELAAGVASELDRQVRELESDAPDQESLL
jgi:hypothetical protein